MKVDLVVSRHEGGIRWVASVLGGEYNPGSNGLTPCIAIPDGNGGDYLVTVMTGNVTPDDVRGKVVCGDLPLGLASLCKEVVAIEFAGSPPRGQEYGMEDMVKAGACLSRYVVEKVG